jgi:uncharacterized phiE125 gp8 family phage protein
MMTLEVTVQPAIEPVTLEQVKEHLSWDNDHFDAWISERITAARIQFEMETRVPLITRTVTYFGDSFSDVIELMPKLRSVNTVKYIDVNGDQQTVDPTVYDIDTKGIVGSIYPAYNKCWPCARYHKNSVEIEFTAGFGGFGSVPENIQQAISALIGTWLQNRESVVVGVQFGDLNKAYDSIASLYRVMSF